MGRKRAYSPDRPSTAAERMRAYNERKKQRATELLTKHGLAEVPVCLPVHALAQIEVYCKYNNLTPSEFIGRSLKQAVEQMGAICAQNIEVQRLQSLESIAQSLEVKLALEPHE